jgi:hypothetical protein
VKPSEPEAVRALLHDARGRPVPFINIWSGEGSETDWHIRTDPLVGRLAFFIPHRPGSGEPDFTKQNIQRQRKCMVRRLCQVCGQAIPPRDAGLLVMSSISVATHEVYEHGPVPLFSEPWCHPECITYAAAICPGLRRRQNQHDFSLIRPRRVSLIESRGWVEGPLERYTKKEQPTMWVKAAVLEWEQWA